MWPVSCVIKYRKKSFHSTFAISAGLKNYIMKAQKILWHLRGLLVGLCRRRCFSLKGQKPRCFWSSASFSSIKTWLLLSLLLGPVVLDLRQQQSFSLDPLSPEEPTACSGPPSLTQNARIRPSYTTRSCLSAAQRPAPPRLPLDPQTASGSRFLLSRLGFSLPGSLKTSLALPPGEQRQRRTRCKISELRSLCRHPCSYATARIPPCLGAHVPFGEKHAINTSSLAA